ncbi:hypothetical protein ACFQE1_20410, partial [Halobium palmae]
TPPFAPRGRRKTPRRVALPSSWPVVERPRVKARLSGGALSTPFVPTVLRDRLVDAPGPSERAPVDDRDDRVDRKNFVRSD